MARDRIVGDYELLDELGRGGTGRVYRARERATGAIRAVKVLEAAGDPEVALRFRREAELLAKVGGRGVISVHQSGHAAGRLFYAMDLLPGGTLRDRMRGPIAWREAATLVAKVARTCGACAAAGLVHRDLKPENVLFSEQGEPVVADFGCVRDLGGSRLTETGTVLGTPHYMAPEQLDGKPVDARADVFALGVILFELLHGKRPFEETTPFALLTAMHRGAPAPDSTVPASLATVLRRALDPRPERRFADGGALATALDAALRAEPRRASLRLAVAAATVMFLVAGVAALASWKREPAPAATVSPRAIPSPLTSPTPHGAGSTPLPAPPGDPDGTSGLMADVEAVTAATPRDPSAVHKILERLDAKIEELGAKVERAKWTRAGALPFVTMTLLFERARALDATHAAPSTLVSQAPSWWSILKDEPDWAREPDRTLALVTLADLLRENPLATRAAARALASTPVHRLGVARARALATRLTLAMPTSPWAFDALGRLLLMGDVSAALQPAAAREAFTRALEVASAPEHAFGPVDRYYVHHMIALSFLALNDEKNARAHMDAVSIPIPPDAWCYRLRAFLAPTREEARKLLKAGSAALAKRETDRGVSLAHRGQAASGRRILDELLSKANDESTWEAARAETGGRLVESVGK